MAIQRISSRKCSRVRSTRGSRKSAKYFRGLSISPSQLATTAPHIAIKIRLPCEKDPPSGILAVFCGTVGRHREFRTTTVIPEEIAVWTIEGYEGRFVKWETDSWRA